MKEVDDLKALWKASTESGPPDKEAIKKMLMSKSDSLISKLRRNLLLDLMFYLLTYPVAILIFSSRESVTEVFAWWTFIITGLLVLIYLGLKYRLLTKMSRQADTVANTLRRQLVVLGKYLSVYFWIGMAIAPVLSGLIVMHRIYEDAAGPQSWVFAVFLWLALNVFFAFPLYFFGKWYIGKLYGRHLDKLRENLTELKEITG